MIQEIKLRSKTKVILGDCLTPINLLLRIRDEFNQTVLLESNDFRSKEDCRSYIGIDIISEIKVNSGVIAIDYPDLTSVSIEIDERAQVIKAVEDYLKAIQYEDTAPVNGLLGHTNFDGVQYFENIDFDKQKEGVDIPDIRYSLFRFFISVDHFKDEVTIVENIPEGEESQFPKLENLINNPTLSTYGFERIGTPKSNMSDADFKDLVRKGKYHCKIGDVFQVVFSRRFEQFFTGDDLNVYRALRSLNPSPYLFYFDYGSYRLFGSSPESQITINGNIASLNPIAGTFRREGDKTKDTQKALKLIKDEKENAEHIMLVDLARNDLSINCDEVWIENLKEIQYFSHVIHLVSKVKGEMKPDRSAYNVYAKTFPAGTLSGAPKYKAMQIIDENEPTKRSFYGGSIGILQLNGDINHAILIRSFLSKNNTLYYQAGAGIVIDSDEEKELQEINNKLGALSQALVNAESVEYRISSKEHGMSK